MSVCLARNERPKKGLVSQCDVCLTHRDSQVQEPLLQHELTFRPWAKVADICFHSGRILLVVRDYFTAFIEVLNSLSSEISKSVIRSLMETFSRFGVPDTPVTDNGPCFASTEYAKFAGPVELSARYHKPPLSSGVMVRLSGMQYTLLSVSSRYVEQLVYVNFKLSWPGVILQVRAWI